MPKYRPDSVVYVSSIGGSFISRVTGYGKRQVRLYGSHDLGERRISRWQFDRWLRDRRLRHTESFHSCLSYYDYIWCQINREGFEEQNDLYREELNRIEHTIAHH